MIKHRTCGCVDHWTTHGDVVVRTTTLCDLHEAVGACDVHRRPYDSPSAATDPPPLEGDPGILPEATAKRARFLRDVRRWSRNLGRVAATHLDPGTAERVIRALDQAKKDLRAELRAEWWLDASRPSALLFCCGVVERALRNQDDQHMNS